MKAFDHDLAISAVSYDSILVGQLIDRLGSRLEQPIVWAGQAAETTADTFPVLGKGARAVLVLLHPLWANDPRTAADSGILRQRMKRQPSTVVVLVLDEAIVPDWLESAPRHDLDAEGLDPVVETLLATIADLGGSLRAPQELDPASAPRTFHQMFDPPPPFLQQARAQTALRRELERVSDALHARLDEEEASEGMEVFSLPNRFILRQGDVAVSFSWVGGRGGVIPDGRLLVIQWGELSDRRGITALHTASNQREVSYVAEGANADTWCWRAERRNGRACSSSNLVAEWLDVAGLRQTRGAVLAEVAQ